MIDHIGIPVTDMAKSVAFYELALAPLGYTKLMDFGDAVGFGTDGKPDFWLGKQPAMYRTHVAFRTKGRGIVRDFHAAAMAAGGTDNGGPGIREHYHPDYYGAFVLDPDGHNVETCCHEAYLG
ncbi:MAG TPA: VOC family protein [Kofleriaceae bacterium]|jgi:catechol 2,3-dioxygenase-like lactoylglutathione lyase family enzyme